MYSTTTEQETMAYTEIKMRRVENGWICESTHNPARQLWDTGSGTPFDL